MTVKRKALSVFACVILVLSLVPIIAYADDTEPDGGTTPTEAVGEIETNALESEQETPQEEGGSVSESGNEDGRGNEGEGQNDGSEADEAETGQVADPSSSRSVNVLRAGGLVRGDTGGTSGGEGDLVLAKSLETDGQGDKVITLEAYASGSMSIVEQGIHCDIVLVLDQSGSMDDRFGSQGSYHALSGYSNKRLGDLAENGNLYVRGGDGSYVAVDVDVSGFISLKYSYTWEGLEAPLTSEGRYTVPQFEGVTFYSFQTDQTVTRIAALKDAANSFVQSVRSNSLGEDGIAGTVDDVPHRIAVIGFASGGNTELFVGSASYPYGQSAQSQYGSAFQDMTTEMGFDNALASIGQLSADGGTLVDDGLDMANGVFSANPLVTGKLRNRVTVVLTDGAPGLYGNDRGVANEAISQASELKTAGSTVFSIGIFPGADASGDLPDQSAMGWGDNDSNRFMHLLSSNYPDASSMGSPGARFVDEEGSSPDYYLSASDSAGLNSIFQSISQSTGGSSVDVGTEAVVRDVVAAGFSLPEAADASSVKVFTRAYLGPDAGWAEAIPLDGAAVVVDGSTVDVSGFDFSGNWVGMREEGGAAIPHGSKLVVRIPVERTATFGGTGRTNDATSGVYADLESEPLGMFEQPIDSAALDFEVASSDDVVYLGETSNIADNVSWAESYVPDGQNNAFVDIAYRLVVDGVTYFSEIPAGTDASGPDFALAWKDSSGNPVETITVLPVGAGEEEYGLSCTVSDAWDGNEAQDDLEIEGQVCVRAVACSVTVGKSLSGAMYHPGDSFLVTVEQVEDTVARYEELAQDCPRASAFLIGSVRAVVSADGSVTVAGLPIGTYRVTEDQAWSWRYEFVGSTGGVAEEHGSSVSLPTSDERPASSLYAQASVTLTNRLEREAWLSHECSAVNVFGVIDGSVEVVRANEGGAA